MPKQGLNVLPTNIVIPFSYINKAYMRIVFNVLDSDFQMYATYKAIANNKYFILNSM